MQLKLLIVPLLAIGSLVMGIFFIKPDYDTLKEKRAALELKKTEALNVQTVEANIAALSQSLNSQAELETFANTYYPASLDQERAIDAMNFLASQSGVILTQIQLTAVEVEQGEEALAPSVPLTSLQAPGGEGGGAEGAALTGDPLVMNALSSSYKPQPAKMYDVSVSASGTYENLRNFIDRISRMDRFSEINRFSVEKGESSSESSGAAEGTDATEGTGNSGDLNASLDARLSYLPTEKNLNALQIPVFQKNSFDFSSVQASKEWAANVVPPLSAGQSGKPNPFQ